MVLMRPRHFIALIKWHGSSKQRIQTWIVTCVKLFGSKCMLHVHCTHMHTTSTYDYHAHLYLAAITIRICAIVRLSSALRVLPDPDSSNVKVNLCTWQSTPEEWLAIWRLSQRPWGLRDDTWHFILKTDLQGHRISLTLAAKLTPYLPYSLVRVQGVIYTFDVYYTHTGEQFDSNVAFHVWLAGHCSCSTHRDLYYSIYQLNKHEAVKLAMLHV